MRALDQDPGRGVIGFGLPTVTPTRRVPASELTRLAAGAHAAGFSTLWTGDHLLLPHPILEPVSTIASLAAQVPGARFGTAVLLAGLRPPERAVREVRTLVALTGGRFELGVGVGGDSALEGLAAAPRRGRGAALDAALAAVRDACGEDLPPVWVGGRSEAALARAARWGGWLGYLESPAGFVRKRQRLAELARLPVATAVVLLAAVVEDRAAADEATAYVRAAFGGAEDVLLRLMAIGSRASVAERAAAYLESGCDHLVLWPLGGDPRRQLEELAAVRAALPRVGEAR